MTMSPSISLNAAILRMGVYKAIHKTAPTDQIIESAIAALRGDTNVAHGRTTKHCIDTRAQRGGLCDLTAEEIEILRQLASGLSVARIAQISTCTVKVIRSKKSSMKSRLGTTW